MGGYLLTRVLSLVPVLFGVSLAVFLLVKLVPGDLATALLGPEARAQDVEDLRRQLGLDQPLPVQYGLWLRKALGGDLGYSLQQRVPVVDLLTARFQNTMLLTVVGAAVSLGPGVSAGVLAAARPGSVVDRGVMLGAPFGTSLPAFWLGIALIVVFAVQLGWLPSGGMSSMFTWPGVGLLTYTAIGARDLPVIQGAILMTALVFTLVNLVTDLLYGWLDPRIRYGPGV